MDISIKIQYYLEERRVSEKAAAVAVGFDQFEAFFLSTTLLLPFYFVGKIKQIYLQQLSGNHQG